MKMTATCCIQKFRWREKNKTLVKLLGGHQHRTTPAGQILGGRDSCNPCGVDAYAFLPVTFTDRLSNKPFPIWLLTVPPHLKYVATLPCNVSLMACFADINVSQGSVAT